MLTIVQERLTLHKNERFVMEANPAGEVFVYDTLNRHELVAYTRGITEAGLTADAREFVEDFFPESQVVRTGFGGRVLFADGLAGE